MNLHAPGKIKRHNDRGCGITQPLEKVLYPTTTVRRCLMVQFQLLCKPLKRCPNLFSELLSLLKQKCNAAKAMRIYDSTVSHVSTITYNLRVESFQ